MSIAELIETFRNTHLSPSAVEKTSVAVTRQLILDATLEIAASEGVKGASMRKISAHVGMRTATIYDHFPDGKDQIVSIALSSLLQRFYRNASQALRAHDSSLENLRSLVFCHVRWYLKNPEIVPAWDVVVGADRITPVLNPVAREEIQTLSNGYRQLLGALAIDLGVDPAEAPAVAETLIVICDGSCKWGPELPGFRRALVAEEFAWMTVRGVLSAAGPDAKDRLSLRSPSGSPDSTEKAHPNGAVPLQQ